MQAAQVGVAAIQRVLVPVVLERDALAHDVRVARVGRADPVVAHARAVGERVVALVVDVVADVDDEVDVLARHQGVGVVVAVGEVLAGEVGELDRLVGVGRQRRREAPDRAVLGARREAVEVALVGAQAADPRLDRVVEATVGAHEGPGHDVAEVRLARHLELDLAGAADAVHARPQRDAAGSRIAGDHAVGEGATVQQRRAARAGDTGRQRLRRRDGGGGERSGAGDESTASEDEPFHVRRSLGLTAGWSRDARATAAGVWRLRGRPSHSLAGVRSVRRTADELLRTVSGEGGIRTLERG